MAGGSTDASARDTVPFAHDIEMRAPLHIPKHPILGRLGLPTRRADDLPSLLDLPHQRLTQSGRAALGLALQHIDAHAGDRVLLPSYHCPTMVAPVVRVGAEPVFYPIQSNGAPDLGYLENLSVQGIRAIIVAHFFGLPVPLREIAGFCRQHRIVMIEDCAHCFFGSTDTGPIGCTGDFAIGSLPKFFPTFEGGFLGSAHGAIDPAPMRRPPILHEVKGAWDLLEYSSRFSRLGLLGAATRTIVRTLRRSRVDAAPSDSEYIELTPDHIHRAAMADPLLEPAQIRHVDAWVLSHSDLQTIAYRRRNNFNALAQRLSGLPEATPLAAGCGLNTAPYVMPLLVRDSDAAYIRMRSLRLPVYRWDRLWTTAPPEPGDSTHYWSHGLIQVSCHQDLLAPELDKLADAIVDCLRRDSSCQHGDQ